MGRKGISYQVVNAIIETMVEHNQHEISLASLEDIRERLAKQEPTWLERIICSVKQSSCNEDKATGNKRIE